MIAPLIFLGLSNGYYYGSVPSRVGDKEKIGYVMTVYGVCEVVGSLIGGKMVCV